MNIVSLAVKTGLIALAVAGLLATSSCARKEVQAKPETQNSQAEVSAPETSQEQLQEEVVQAKSPEPEQVPEKTEPVAAAPVKFPDQTIYFGYDSAVLTADAKDLTREKAEWLNQNPDVAVVVEGHCDQRGSEAYNKTLGLQRAQAVKQHLGDLGVKEQQISCVSFGESTPVQSGQTEAAYEKNRRAEFKLLQQVEN